MFAFFLTTFFDKDFLYNYRITNRLKKFLAFFIYLYLIAFIIDIIFLDNDNIKIINNDFFDDSQSGITNFNLGNILLSFQNLFKYSKYFDLTVFSIIFLIYNSQGIKLITNNKVLITAILLFFILQGNSISIIIYIFFLSLIIFLDLKQKKKIIYTITFLATIFIGTMSVVDILSYKGFIKFKYNQYNYKNNNFSQSENVNPLFSKTIIFSKIDELSSRRLQRWIVPCTFLEKRYSQFPSFNYKNEVSKVYKTCPFSDNKGFLTCDEYNLFLRGELKPKSN